MESSERLLRLINKVVLLSLPGVSATALVFSADFASKAYAENLVSGATALMFTVIMIVLLRVSFGVQKTAVDFCNTKIDSDSDFEKFKKEIRSTRGELTLRVWWVFGVLGCETVEEKASILRLIKISSSVTIFYIVTLLALLIALNIL